MYSILPAIVALFFLGYGLYVVFNKGFTRVSAAFLILCLTTFFWQSTWTILFQVSDPNVALFLVKFGYFFIIFLPSSFYHFLVEVSERKQDLVYVYFSYGVALGLAVVLLTSDLFVSGYYEYFFGYYPKAGTIHPLHLLQTIVVGARGLYITYTQQKVADPEQRTRLRFFLFSLCIYYFAAVDYLCNYGLEFYPPGVIFIVISLGIIALAMVKYELMTNSMVLAASVAHEMRTPLLNIRLQASGIAQYLPTLFKGYDLAVKHQLMSPEISRHHLGILKEITENIESEVTRTNFSIDLLLASATADSVEADKFSYYSIKTCVDEVLRRYPFEEGGQNKVTVNLKNDFMFFGSDVLSMNVLFNLLNNSFRALTAAGKGDISITIGLEQGNNCLEFTDTGIGIKKDVLPHVFDNFYTTKCTGGGIGLTFCKKAMRIIGGSIECHSRENEYTTFILKFPNSAQPKPI